MVFFHKRKIFWWVFFTRKRSRYGFSHWRCEWTSVWLLHCTRMQVCDYACVHVNKYMNACEWMNACVFVCVCVFVSVCVCCVFACMYIYYEHCHLNTEKYITSTSKTVSDTDDKIYNSSITKSILETSWKKNLNSMMLKLSRTPLSTYHKLCHLNITDYTNSTSKTVSYKHHKITNSCD